MDHEYAMDLRDAICICAILASVGVENDALIQRICSAHARDVLEAIAAGA